MSSIEVKRKGSESIESLLRRFRRRLQQTKILIKAKEDRFYQKPKSKKAIRVSALARKRIREKREYLKKIGKLKEEETRY